MLSTSSAQQFSKFKDVFLHSVILTVSAFARLLLCVH